MNDQKILIACADDHAIMRDGLSALLKQSPTIEIVILAKNGSELIDLIKKTPILPDIVLLDINMPLTNGFEAQIELSKNWPGIRTLVLTVHENELYIIKMIMIGARGYLLKDCTAKELETAIAAVYNRGYYHSRQASSALFRAVESRMVKLPHFTEHEKQVLKFCCSDLIYADIAKQMNTTMRSVMGYRDSLFKKLQVNSRTSLALRAVELGLVILNNPNFSW
jgi:two-component system invasion response regulator UvrY